VKTDHTLWCWGSNDLGQLGNGTTTDSAVPVREHTHASDWTAVSTDWDHTCAVKTDHTLWCWGSNDYGQLGNGTTTDSAVPVREHTHANDWAAVSAGGNVECDPSSGCYGLGYTCAVKNDHSLWCWGLNDSGQLGDGTTTSSAVPVREHSHASDWAAVSASVYHTCAMKTDHTLWCWGYNGSGELGDGTTTESDIPVREHSHAGDWAAVSAGGGHTCAVKTDHTLWCWGSNGTAELGNGTTTNSTVPVRERTHASDWAAVSAGEAYTCAVKTDHTLWCWGDNGSGELGIGVTASSAVPVREHSHASNWTAVSAGEDHTCAVKTGHTLWCWGDNGTGQLGDGGPTTRSDVPVQERTHASDWAAVSAGGDYTCAVKTDHSLWCWGDNGHGELGDGTTTDSAVPVREHTHASNWTAVSAGGDHTCAVKTDHTLWCWGSNPSGELGNGTATDSDIPVREHSHAGDWAAVSAGWDHTCAVKTGHTLWCWGDNGTGQLGDGGPTTDSAVPVREHTHASDWTAVSAGGDYTCAVKTGHTLWCWGDNGTGQLGDGGPTTGSDVPVQEHNHASDWTAVSAGGDHACAVKTDHSLWCWGNNYSGQLGIGVAGYFSTPEQVTRL
jgi:alpha-tubulin suppressor-like RCC1 family protein